MAIWLIPIAVNVKRGWLRVLCFWIAGLFSIFSMLGSAEMFYVVALREFIAWCLGFAIGYGIRYWRRQGKKTNNEGDLPSKGRSHWKL